MSDVPSPPRRVLFWVGLPLMGIGLAITAVFLPLFLLGGPVFLVGLVLVWVSGRPWWARLLATVAPFVGWVGVATLALTLSKHTAAATFLIPEGFEGQIMLVLGEPCGLPPEKADGYLLYHVPANGIIITQNKLGEGELNNEYYLVDRKGQRLRELTELSDIDGGTGQPQPTTAWRAVSRDELAVFPDSPITTTGYAPVVYTFQLLTVTSFARRSHLSDGNWQAAQRALVDSLVPHCRQYIGQHR
ncbi:MAG: DUF6843 domain-containing protein [Janthinobacterium lividum]